MILSDVKEREFWREREQTATRPRDGEHICKDCGEPIPLGLVYRVTVWKKGRRFQWKKTHIIC